MNIITTKCPDIANGLGCRLSLFVSGCTRYCPGCFNEESWDFASGTPFDDEMLEYIIDRLDFPHIRGITILGGEPLHAKNLDGVHTICSTIRKELPNKNIWVYSGYTFEELLSRTTNEPLLNEFFYNNDKPLIDVLVDGPYIKERHNVALPFRGSSNQRIIDVVATCKNNVLTEINIT